MITLCGWCKQYLGGAGDSVEGISHGICPQCRAAEDASWAPGRTGEEPDGDPVRGLKYALLSVMPIWIVIIIIIWAVMR